MKSIYMTVERVLKSYRNSGHLKVKEGTIAAIAEEIEESQLQEIEKEEANQLRSVAWVMANPGYVEFKHSFSGGSTDGLLPRVTVEDVYAGAKPVKDGYVSLSKNPSWETTAAVPCKVYGYSGVYGRGVTVVLDVESVRFKPFLVKMIGTLPNHRLWLKV